MEENRSGKSRERQAALSMHRARDLLVKQRTQLVNMMRELSVPLGAVIWIVEAADP